MLHWGGEIYGLSVIWGVHGFVGFFWGDLRKRKRYLFVFFIGLINFFSNHFFINLFFDYKYIIYIN